MFFLKNLNKARITLIFIKKTEDTEPKISVSSVSP